MLRSPLLVITLELKLSIISFLHFSDKCNLRLTCQMFNNLLALDVPHEQLRVAQKKKTILLVEDANEGEPGYQPFFIFNVRKVEISESDDTAALGSAQSQFRLTRESKKQLLFDVYRPKFMCNELEQKNNVEWVIHICMRDLELEEGHDIDKLKLESPRIFKSVEYESVRGKLVEVSAAMLRRNFVCRECKDSRSVCVPLVGCGTFSKRFPKLSAGFGWQIPCPVCIGYEVASMATEAQAKETDELWDDVNGMLEEEND
ncbi:hypothetical protein BDP27DRAFT_1424931 [Rhodocollybia butyracea]|uniref:F-box domain-containing protein n=1 Tax=Rhodocollybia butyracea TaxID=206335 RepID=A0A9P5PL85_9AGAR|nr:hypothetical protein BDP27DRAFT_1424931 [Rhodocollybia butyracea]